MSTSNPTTTQPLAAIQKELAKWAQEVILAEAPGKVQGITNTLVSDALSQSILLDPGKIQAYTNTIASQINSQGGASFTFSDLADRIADIKINTSAQGASTLEVDVIDPYWVILNITDKQGNHFFQTDVNGYLWPPIDINFPEGQPVYWRLCQVRATLSAQPTGGNLILTFEDRIVSQLRNVSVVDGGIAQGSPNVSLGGFFKQLIDSANKILGSSIQLVELISPADPNYQAPNPPTPPKTIAAVGDAVASDLSDPNIAARVGAVLAGVGQTTTGAALGTAGAIAIQAAEAELAASIAELHSQANQASIPGYTIGKIAGAITNPNSNVFTG